MNIHEIINGCKEIEKSAATVYSNLMRLFPKEMEFWGNLFDDEAEHLIFLINAESLGLISELEKIVLPPSIPVLNKTLKLAGNITEKITKNPVSLEDALRMTLKLEETMVETYTNTLIANLLSFDNESYIEKILISEKLHVDKIRNMMIKEGFLKLS
jgi:rubrerythrin